MLEVQQKPIQPREDQNLLVYRSSAGSGKTYTLVKTYLILLFQSPSDFGFKEILAITFTNKAASEMKKKVLDALDNIYREGINNKLAIEISKENNFDINKLVKRARIISKKILHNYKDFNLMTIDKFTNKVIRSFSNELGLSNNYNILLEENEFIEEVISEYIDEISKDPNQLDILQNMIDHSIGLGLKNNIENQLNKLKKIIFKSNYKFQNPLSAEETQKLRKFIFKELKSNKKRLKDLGDLGLSLLNEYEILDSWMLYGRIKVILNSTNNLSKLSFRDIEKWNSWIEKEQWFKKSLKVQDLETVSLVYDKIISIIQNIIQDLINWLKLLEVHKLIIPFSMVQSLMDKIIKEKTLQNAILISDFNDLVSDIIKDEPAGFIFEKIGSRFKFILIDEFQDTSTLQWNNLIPLVHESLSVGGKNLIVGDAKQAIYRWRNGNVNQFVNLPKITDPNLKKLYEPLFDHSIFEDDLKNNWRSSINIINFNNWFFKQVVQNLEEPKIQQAYKGLHQNHQRKCEGLVNIRIYEKSNLDLTNYLENCISNAELKGYQLNDISILVRSKKDAVNIINSLLILKKSFVSEDCLFLSSSISYRILYSFLSYLEGQEERDFKILNHFLDVYFSKNQSILKKIKSQLLTFDFNSYNNLYDFQKINFVISFLNFNSNDPFVDFFMNLSNQLLINENFSIFELLEYFKNKSGKLTIENNSKNAIQILTIHKSKGLEFPVVIVPLTNWHVNNSLDSPYEWVENIVLEEEDIELFIGEMSHKSLVHLGKEEIYKIEQEEVLLDTLNLYYVAFTRAVDQMYISFEDSDKKNNLSSLMVSVIKNHKKYNSDLQLLQLYNSEEHSCKDIKKEIDNSDFLNLSNFKIINEAEKIKEQLSFASDLNFGTFFHDVMSKLFSDFSTAYYYLDQKKRTSTINDEYYLNAKIYLNKIQDNKTLDFIFDSNQIIYNEKEFLSKDNEILRLDRLMITKDRAVIIDYKTSKGSNDLDQVRNYLKNINLTTFKAISAYLLYVKTQELVEVTL
ncbi:MAG: UvrD-helicase domain-containing protein [Flavobacteriales bacterium]|nr:UvrD-helicase domain-containing protein [Flavobacteriales bacterium]